MNRWKTKRLYAETFRMSYFRKETDFNNKTSKKLSSIGGILNFDNAIWWYSFNEAPIFDQMNNILRLENFELLMCHRYYISDLCQMIERAHSQTKLSSKLIVYRADKLNRTDFDTLVESKDQKDAIISINGFISTSRNKEISLQYAAAKLRKQGNDVVILYEITIDPAVSCSAFADIQSISFHPEEEEILFNMGATFQICDIDNEPSDANIKRIKLLARDFNRPLLDSMKAKVKHASQATLSILLARYLIELGEDRVSKRYLTQLIDSKQLENDTNLVAVYNSLGTIYFRQTLYGEALDCYQKALDTQARLQFSNNNSLAEIFNYIGQTHLSLGQLDEAQENLEEGIRIQKREPKHAQQHLAELYSTLGQVAYARKEYDEAESNFQSSYDLYKRNTKISHDALERRLLSADLCLAYGHLLSVKNPTNSSLANEKFREALDIYESTLPASHPKITEARMDIICEYARNHYYDAVISFYNERLISLLKTYEFKQTTSQRDLAKFYSIIGACYAYRTEFDKAMALWTQSIGHEFKSFLDELLSSTRSSRIIISNQFIADAYRQAFEYYSQNENTSNGGEYLGLLYAKKCIYEKAVECLRGMSSYLLANICITQRNSKGILAVYKRILDTQDYDLSSMVGILLRMLTMTKTAAYEEALKELAGIDKLLMKTPNENEAIHLRMIINDYLAEAHLLAKRYERALQRSRLSFDLKQRHYSPNHPSLVRNYQLHASCAFQQNDSKNAISYYEKAIEIQLDNMSSNHRDIRLNYFLLGDCYCQMDKLDMAKEFYEQAQTSADTDEENQTETKENIEALKRMNTNLAKLYAKSNMFTIAHQFQTERVTVVKKNLSEYVIEIIENDDASIVSYERLQMLLTARLCPKNGETFAQVLRNLVYIYLSLARALIPDSEKSSDGKDSMDLFEQAIQLDLKLTIFKNDNDKSSFLLYEELSETYKRLYYGMTNEIKENLMKALDGTVDRDKQISIEYRLGHLCFNDEDYFGSNYYWQQAFDRTHESQTTIRTILEKLLEKNQEKLDAIKEEDDDDDDDELEDDANKVEEEQDDDNELEDDANKVEEEQDDDNELEDDANKVEEEQDTSEVDENKDEKSSTTETENKEARSRVQSSKSQRPNSKISERPESTESQHPKFNELERPKSTESQRPKSNKSEHRPDSKKSEHPDSIESQRPKSNKSERPSSNKSVRALSSKSISDKVRPNELAQAYFNLSDNEMALKYFKKYAVKLASLVKYSLPNKEIEERPLSIIKFFHDFLLKTIDGYEASFSKSENISHRNQWLNLLNTYKKIYDINVQLNNSNEDIAKANLVLFEIYQKLYNIPETIITLYQLLFENDLDWTRLVNLLELNQSVNLLMALAAYYTSEDEYSTALEIYCTLQDLIKSEGTMKSAVNYGLLKLFSLYLQSDKERNTNIRAIELHSSDIPIFDRILLCRLIVSFFEEMEDEQSISEYKTELFNLQNELWTIESLETLDCIGKFLDQTHDSSLTRFYWNDIQDIYHEMFTEPFFTQLYSSDSSFEQLYRATKQTLYDLPKNIVSLGESYEILSTYNEQNNWKTDAYDCLKKSIIIYEKIPAYKSRVTQLKDKLSTLTKD